MEKRHAAVPGTWCRAQRRGAVVAQPRQILQHQVGPVVPVQLPGGPEESGVGAQLLLVGLHHAVHPGQKPGRVGGRHRAGRQRPVEGVGLHGIVVGAGIGAQAGQQRRAFRWRSRHKGKKQRH